MCCTYLIPHSLSCSLTYVSSLIKNCAKRETKGEQNNVSLQASSKVESIMYYKMYPIRWDKKKVSLSKRCEEERESEYARACLFWSNVILSLECGPVSPAAKARRGWPWNEENTRITGYAFLLPHNWLNTFADYVAYLHFYTSINTPCIWKCPHSTPSCVPWPL